MDAVQKVEMTVIATIQNDFDAKFGIPRQSGLVEQVISRIVFEPEYRNPHALRGLEDYSHLWLVWQFSEHADKTWSPTVRPPRLGGNTRVGVFATRSSFRPNAIGLSSVRLDHIEYDPLEGPVIVVRGADLMNGTPLLDIKPYLPYVDAHPDATGSFAEKKKGYCLHVKFLPGAREMLEAELNEEQLAGLREILSQDPRPSYQEDEQRVYGMAYAGQNIRFRVANGVLLVLGKDG